MEQVKSQLDSTVFNSRFSTVVEMFMNDIITKDEFTGLMTMLTTSVAEAFIADRKAGN